MGGGGGEWGWGGGVDVWGGWEVCARVLMRAHTYMRCAELENEECVVW